MTHSSPPFPSVFEKTLLVSTALPCLGPLCANPVVFDMSWGYWQWTNPGVTGNV